ncbi:MAG: TonB-dependent receptor [Acidobacteria bacterium]|nr:TonB-dependent receptor [Acidobacteriota bacterium]
MKRTLIAALVVLLAPAMVFAQATQTGRVVGTVKDASGTPVEGARVSITSPSLQGERLANTSETGEFIFGLLPVGAYIIQISAPQKRPVDITFNLGLGQTVPLDVVLEPGSDVTEEVTVFGAATRLETTSNGENFNYDDAVEELPIQNRGLEAVAILAPNIIEGATAGTLQIAGAPSFETNVFLDGSEISDPFFGDSAPIYIEDAIEEVQVLTSGISAKYGRFTGGLVNAISKSGGNEFTATARVELDKESWNSQTPADESQSDTLNKTWSGTVGGYVLRDRLWFFGALRTASLDNSLTTNVTNGSFTEVDEEDRWQLKLRGAFTPDHVLELGYYDYERTVTPDDVLTSLPAGERRAVSPGRKAPWDLYTLSYGGILTPSLFLDVSATQLNVETNLGGDPSLRAGDLAASPFTGNLGVFNNSLFDSTDTDVRDNETWSANLTWALGATSWGSHTIEAGVQFVNSIVEGFNEQSPTRWVLRAFDDLLATEAGPGGDPVPLLGEDGDLLFFVESGRAFRFRSVADELAGSPKSEIQNLAFYAQDSWEIGDWRVDAGVRWENYESDGLQPTQNFDFDDVSPRIGVTWNFAPDWQAQATWGRYVARFSQNHFNETQGTQAAPRFVDFYVGPSTGNISRGEMEAILQGNDDWVPFLFFGPLNDAIVLDAGIESAYSDDFNVALKHALGGRGSFSVTYTNRRFRNLLDDFVGGSGPDGWIEVPDPDFGVPSIVDQTVWKNTSKAEREYTALTLTFDYRPGPVWNIGGNYTYSQLRGNYEGEAGNQPGIGSDIGNYEGAAIPGTVEPYGILAGDVPNRARVWANYRLDFERWGQFVLGSLLTFSDGFNWARADTFTAPIDDPNSINEAFSSYTYYLDRADRIGSRVGGLGISARAGRSQSSRTSAAG